MTDNANGITLGTIRHESVPAIEGEAGTALDVALTIQRCEGCGAPVDETSSRCAYCGTPRSVVVKLESELQALLALLDTRLDEVVKLRTDFILIVVFFLFLLSGPVCYIALGLYTDNGMVTRIAAAVATEFFGLVAFGWQCDSRETQAEQIAWRDVIAIEISRFIENKKVSATEFIVMAQRLLKDDSRLRKVILKWMPS
jgi:hypothetical protein